MMGIKDYVPDIVYNKFYKYYQEPDISEGEVIKIKSLPINDKEILKYKFDL